MIAPRTTPPYLVGLLLLGSLGLGAGLVMLHRPDPCRFSRPTVAARPSPIVCSGNHCVIERRRVAALLTQPSTFGSVVRIVPSLGNGRSANYLLLGIRPGSVAARLGLRNGDRIVGVNGRTFRYPDDALHQYFEVKHADRVTLDVSRNAQLVRYDYEIR